MDPRSERLRTAGREDADGVELHTLQWGETTLPRLVLLHGGGANAHWWDHLAPHFADRFHVVALDFRGHGDSERPRDLVVGAFNDDLEALLAHLGSHNAVLIGHSMGAHVALDHAARFAKTHALALLDPSRGGGARLRRRFRLALSFRRTYASREEATERYRFLPPADHASEALRHAIAHCSVQQESDGRWSYKFDPRWFGLPSLPRPDLARIACPTLVMRGEESPVLTEDGAREICAELPDARLASIERAGHHVQIDQPEAVLRALSHFLDELPQLEG